MTAATSMVTIGDRLAAEFFIRKASVMAQRKPRETREYWMMKRDRKRGKMDTREAPAWWLSRPDEIEACFPFLKRQVELIAPVIICTLGRPAANTLLQTNASMGSLRGRWHSFDGVRLMPTYHPAYLLRSPGQKRKTWQDLKQIIVELHEGA